MKTRFITNIFLLFFFCGMSWAQTAADYPKGYPKSDRTKISVNADWKFYLGKPDADFYQQSFNDDDWENVCIPHTLKLTSIALDHCTDDKTQETFQRNVGWYRKDLFVEKSNKKVYLEFEGAHQITTLWINGKKVGMHKTGGYTPFNFDVTSFVKKGENNQVTLLVDNRRSLVTPPDPGPFDYIKFSGLYRDVYLVEKNPVHFTSNIKSLNSGITITTPSLDFVNGNATINICSEVINETTDNKKVKVVHRVVDREGNVVLKFIDEAVVEAGRTYHFNQINGLEDNVKFWSIDDPYLYRINSLVYVDNSIVDVEENILGLRKFILDPEKGFILNGKPIELIGFNRHQHFPYIGDALPNSLHRRDMIQFKQWGFNCVRTAHYPQDDELIRACDELGILVYEEPPTWISISQNPEWYANEAQAARVMVRNHKNHPSVVIWGAGINHRGYVPKIHYAIKQEDPTRLTASQSSRWTGWQCSGLTDIFGNMNYGPGIWDRQEPLFAMEGHYGPETIAEYKRDPKMPGMISWTAHAYYTFHDFGNQDDRTRLGAMDGFRYPKNDSLFWYPSEMNAANYVHIKNDWTETLKKLVIYSNAKKIELSVNNKPLGTFYPSTNAKYIGLDHPPYEITSLRYEKGELSAKAYFNDGSTQNLSVYTPTKAVKIRLSVDTLSVPFKADGNDIVVAHAEVLDKNGTRIRNYRGKVKFTVKGDATIVGDGTEIESNPVLVKNGVASALIRAGFQVDKISVEAKSKSLKSGKAQLTSVKPNTNYILAHAYPIQDYEEQRVDLGGDGQLLQFDWTPWNGKGEQSTFSNQNIDYSLSTISENGVLRWLGEMNVIGKYGFVYGDGVLALDDKGLQLEIKNLDEGTYHLITYHHAPSSNTNDMDPNLERLKKEVIHKLPYAKTISVEAKDKLNNKNTVNVSSGEELQYSEPATSNIIFKVSKKNEVIQICFKSLDKNKGVWLNGFKLVHVL